MTDYPISGLQPLSSPASGDLLVAVDVSDHATAPAGAGGSDKNMTLANAAKAFASLGGYVVGIQPSGDTSGVTDTASYNAAVAALGSNPGRILFGDGSFYINQSTATAITRSGVYVDGMGKWATHVYAVNAGDTFSMRDPNLFTDSGAGGGIRGMTIDGSMTTGTSTGIHAGDLLQPQFDVEVVDFAFNSSSIGVKFDNIWAITEQIQGLIHARGNYTGVEFTQTPGVGNTSCFGSFERANLTICLDQQNANYNGIVFSGGTYFDNSVLNVLGNFTTSASAVTSAVFTLSGSTPSGSQDGAAGTIPTNLRNLVMNTGVECDAGLAHAPTTWSIASGCYVQNISGVMNFGAAGAFTPTSGVVGFWGLTDGGDPNIIPQSSQSWLFLGNLGIGTYASPAALASNGTIAVTSGWAIVAPAAAVTGIIMSAGTLDGQLMTVFNASNFSITMAPYGTSHVYTGAPEIIPAWQMRQYWWSVTEAQWTPTAQGQGSTTAALATSFTSATGTAQQNVTGLAALLNVGTWKVRGWFPYVGAGTVGSTQKFAFTFSGTASGSAGYVAWTNKAAAYAAPTVGAAVTTAVTTATITSTVYVMEVEATVVVSAAGTLQLTVQSTTSGDEITIEAGARLEVTQVA
jgi:hypothetical protein